MPDTNLPLAYAVSRLRHPEHPGLTRREYLSYRRWARRRLIWWIIAASCGGLMVLRAI